MRNNPTEEQIRDHAYRLWEAAGSPADREAEFWYEAQRQLSTQGAGEGSGNGVGNGARESSWANPDEKSETFLE